MYIAHSDSEACKDEQERPAKATRVAEQVEQKLTRSRVQSQPHAPGLTFKRH